VKRLAPKGIAETQQRTLLSRGSFAAVVRTAIRGRTPWSTATSRHSRAWTKGGTVGRPEIGEAIHRGEFVPCDPCAA
jgi:hypothetical protein